MADFNGLTSSYVSSLFARQDEALRQALEDGPKLGLPAISIQADEGRFLQFLVRACGASKALEIGTLDGYSGIWIARGLLPGGRLITLDHEARHASIARQNFAAAGVADQIEVRVGEALPLLHTLVAEGPFDFVFIDADKTSYAAYFAWALENVRLGGVIAAHNAFWYGKVFDETNMEADAVAMRAFNRMAAQERRVISTIFPAGDGTLIAVKIA